MREIITTNDSLWGLKDLADTIQNSCEDYIVEDAGIHNIKFNAEEKTLSFKDSRFNEWYERSLTDFSLSQLCTKIGVPSGYISKCIESGREKLAERNVNVWLLTYGRDLMIRGYNDSVRGILSGKFTAFDAPEVLEVLGNTVNGEEFEVKGSMLNPERLHIRIGLRERLTPKDDLFAGFSIDSSDVGRKTLSASFFIYKKVCTNGLIIRKKADDLFSHRHIGISKDKFVEGFQKGIERLPQVAAEYNVLLNKARDKKIEESVAKEILEKESFSKDGSEKVIQLMHENYGSSYLGFINAITDAAKVYTLEKRVEIETFAGNLLKKAA